ncbi:hypothetical protein [Clostridium estertheticum]|uniref:Uncharacterized protein n=1 Tax=Clostridium estertheticum TaxID=238834 RepID=A0AA47EIM1_9CLOT|nr:hypothetical protein [Clostridium estertheticum]MBU3153482.1 hypothetical protein [Clostridium estertheticum]WAG60884.1 hypothetical protein LL038_01130 [Clostridium estertheticum]
MENIKKRNVNVTEGSLKERFMIEKGGFIPMTRRYALVLGLNATGLLIDLCDKYEYYKATGELNKYDEFFLTVPSVEIATGLTKAQQVTAIKILIKYKLVEGTNQRGLPKRRYFKMAEDINKQLDKILVYADDKEKEILARNRVKPPTKPTVGQSA